MRIILSPAKKMITDADAPAVHALPQLLDRTERLLEALRAMTPAELQRLWKCNDQIAAQNVGRLAHMDLRRGLTPALLAYDGIAFKCMAPQIFTCDQEEYVAGHLRILSGFYGILRPFDGVTPYRLEMQARLAVDGAKDLYAFWGGTLAKSLTRETDVIVNLASREYSDAVLPHLGGDVRVVTCVFGEMKGDRVIEKGTLCKMARGEMVRFMAENHIGQPEQMRMFDRLGYRYDGEKSDGETYVFIRQDGKRGA